jgi:hypothetical protein
MSSRQRGMGRKTHGGFFDEWDGLFLYTLPCIINFIRNEISTGEAGPFLRVSEHQVRYYNRQGLFPARRFGQRVLMFRLRDEERFVKPKRTGRHL